MNRDHLIGLVCQHLWYDQYLRLSCVLVAIVLVGCNQSGPPSAKVEARGEGEMLVSAAASLKDAFQEIGQLHEERTGERVRFNFAASGVLQKQIEAGSPADVFASAGAKQMDEVEAKGLLDPGSRHDFARNTLVLITPAGAANNIKSFADLARPEVGRVAVGNPKTVPAGEYTRQLLANGRLLAQLESRLILAEDVRQVLDYVRRGEVDAGIVYASDVGVAGDQVTVAARAAEELHEPITYPIAVIKGSRNREAAVRFVELVRSAEGQRILNKYGFLSPRPGG